MRALFQQRRQSFYEPAPSGGSSKRAFPDGDDMPAEIAKGCLVAKVAGTVAVDFGFPPRAARFRHAERSAMFMAMPETTVNKDHCVILRQDEIGPARQGTVQRTVHRETIAETVKHGTQRELGLCIPPTDLGHDLGALFR